MSAADERIVRVLNEHPYIPSLARGVSRCGCGQPVHGMRHEHLHHVAAALVAAGVGIIADAKAEALLFCRECSEAKHRNCDGTAWSNEADATVPCTCPDPTHMSGRAAAAIADLVVDDAQGRGL